ncbi:DUF4383 domain-containing protein [Mycolicibacterium novocastrense]|uniref:DUF4383 domain-containing protein n=1 Tax=Mycolicibacterium novocastrense TaxID=59813 RepID=A0AAW5SH83_MYCNV|nr:DUF4383 domain-containing protein [Mycolicibacterium novocastrense]MCV7023134.1 DUF4383 domain-containing protein [Mycolicibacterium novocastrense]
MAVPGSQGSPKAAPTAGRAPVQRAAVAVGAVFLLVGVLGFIPGVTTNYDALTFAGHHSGAQLLGVFNVSVLHNIVHLAFGVLGIALSGTFTAARGYLIGGGLVYAALGLYGLVIDHDSPANFMPVNTADNWLHLGLAAAMFALGVLLGRTGDAPDLRRD